MTGFNAGTLRGDTSQTFAHINHYSSFADLEIQKALAPPYPSACSEYDTDRLYRLAADAMTFWHTATEGMSKAQLADIAIARRLTGQILCGLHTSQTETPDKVARYARELHLLAYKYQSHNKELAA